jgi:hypothetical protein
MTLANEMAATVEADEQHREELVGVAMVVGQWLAEEGRPGRWDTVAPAELLRVLALPDGREADGFLHTLAGLVAHAALHEQIEADAARRILGEIAGLAESPPVARFAARMAEQLAEPG